MDDYEALIDSLTPELYERLKTAVETGRWPDGRPLSEAQRSHSMSAVIAWGERHLPPEERIGFIDRGRKGGPGSLARTGSSEQPLRWQERGDGHDD
jgi:uncharacterized protein YeaC (DUF1315 family)